MIQAARRSPARRMAGAAISAAKSGNQGRDSSQRRSFSARVVADSFSASSVSCSALTSSSVTFSGSCSIVTCSDTKVGDLAVDVLWCHVAGNKGVSETVEEDKSDLAGFEFLVALKGVDNRFVGEIVVESCRHMIGGESVDESAAFFRAQA